MDARLCYRAGRPQAVWLEQLRVLAGCLALGERVCVISRTKETAHALLRRVEDSGLLRLLPVEARIVGSTSIELRLQTGAVLRVGWTYGQGDVREATLRGYEGQVIVEEDAA